MRLLLLRTAPLSPFHRSSHKYAGFAPYQWSLLWPALIVLLFSRTSWSHAGLRGAEESSRRNVTEFEDLPGINFPHNDLPGSPLLDVLFVGECRRRCEAHPSCRAFSFSQSSAHWPGCWLKGWADKEGRVNKHFISGRVNPDKFGASASVTPTRIVGSLPSANLSVSEVSASDASTPYFSMPNFTALHVSQGAGALLEVWSQAYQLDAPEPPANVRLPDTVWAGTWGHAYPLAPHLQDCGLLDQKWRAEEARGGEGQDPQWLVRSKENGRASAASRPPWVEGAEEDNLFGTRLMQSQLWQRQFPPNCSDPSLRFAVMPWPERTRHGTGSSIHLMAQGLAHAFASGRIFVPMPGSFQRAEHKGCTGTNFKSLDCYFFPWVDSTCVQQAMDQWEAHDQWLARGYRNERNHSAVMAMDNQVVLVAKGFLQRYSSFVPEELENTWNDNPINIEIFGHLLTKSKQPVRLEKDATPRELDEQMLKAIWWRSQAVRFFLRHPQPYLCHATNQMRHAAFGRLVAEQLAQVPRGLAFAEQQSSLFKFGEERFLRANPLGRAAEGEEDASLEHSLRFWRARPPFLPRPIVSIHVRQGDKAKEMRLFSLASHMWLAERLRRHNPDLTNVWLSSEMKAVIDRSHLYSNWTVFYADFPRQEEDKDEMANYETKIGMERLTMFSFVNLQLASECDYFIGGLASNWPRLLNELRMTGGRLKNGFMAVNWGEF
eukprot:TRINITY_DN15717_c0_g4_i1.p1 TRINITY_DN15717_c0_g4~~TRINITY_DN15717_c0_g4_i1.p1  ORF type:complete len:717 (-),score=115.90 TRINITY_DN15717_c0_g4_i1:562-2712(-)